MEHILKLEQVKKYYGGAAGNITKAVDGISMEVNKGEFTAIMGASGSGKTTLLNCISTIDTVTAGHITVNHQDITKIKEKDFASFRRKNLGFIFQDFNLLDTLTIEENISLSLIINKANPSSIERRVHAIADKLGIRDILSKFPYEVSGGQKQRCACARALINEPNLILADEPTGALDSRSSRLLLETMSDINRKMHTTILMVTHDPFSASFCERILFLKDGKLFNEIFKGEKSRKEFFNEILDILTLLGVKARPGLVVLRRTKMPAVLVEVGFINSDTDNMLFDDNFSDIALAIAEGILDTLGINTPVVPLPDENEAPVAPLPDENTYPDDAFPNEDNVPVVPLPPRYTVQTGAFRNPLYAERLRRELSELDFPASVVEGNGLYRVMVGVFPTLHDAAETERRLRSAGYQTVIVSQ